MYFDWTYFVLVIPAMIFAMWASSRVNRTFEKYQSQYSANGITGAEAARRILDANGLQNVPIDLITGKLTDNYDPAANVIRLSQSVYNGTSTAAVGIACHEVGHALQYAENYPPVRLRMAIIPPTRIGSRLAVPLIIIGILLGSLSYFFTVLAYIGIAFFALSTLFQLVTLPVELNASRRALKMLEGTGILGREENAGARKVLTAAAMTYVAALAASVLQLLRLVLLAKGRSRDD